MAPAGSNSASSNAPLTHVHSFGLAGQCRNNVGFIDEGICYYPVGHNVAIYHTDSREQELIPGCNQPPIVSEKITSLAISPNRRLLAVGEKCTNENGVVNIYDSQTLRRRKMLNYADMGSPEILHICFSNDSKLCLTTGGAPDFTLVLWNVEKAVKVITTIKLATPSGNAVYRADFCPTDPTVISVTGNGILRFFRIVENSFRPISLNIKREPQNYVSQCWLPDDRIVVATSSGELMIIENFEFKCILSCSPGDGKSTGSIVSYSKGFVVGGNDEQIRIYEHSDDSREFYKLSKVFTIKQPSKATTSTSTAAITNMAVSPSEDTLLVSTSDYQLWTFGLSNTDILKEDGNNFDLLMSSFHSPGKGGSAQISGIDTCIWKPLVVTCGLDCSVRVWNYQEKSLELMKTFEEECHSIALHPSGLYVVVGFTDKLRLLSILMDDMRVVRDLNIKSCREVKFSHGGQYFAAVNNTTVHVYNTFTCELVSTMRGHNGKVRTLFWKQGDRLLCTAGMDGAVFVWNVSAGTKESEQLFPRCSFVCGMGTPDLSKGYMCGADNTIKELELATMKQKGEIPVDKSMSQLVVSGSNKIIFGGTAQANKPGVIQVFKVTSQLQGAPQDYNCHSGPVSCMRMSSDNGYLFTGGEDGSLCIFEVNDVEYKGMQRGRDREAATDFAEEILVTKADLEERAGSIQALRNKVEELTLNNDYQLRLKDMNYKEKIKEVSDKFTNELEADRARYEALMDEKVNMEGEYEEKLRRLHAKHGSEFQELEEGYNTKINTEVQRYETLASEREEQNRNWDEENQQLVDSHTEFLQELTDEYDKKVENEQLQQKNLSTEKEDMVAKFEKLKELVEEDAEQEVENLKQKYENKLTAERKATLRLRGENGFMKKKYDAMIKDVNDHKEEIGSLYEKEKELHETIKGLEKDIQGHKKEIREREETIVDKEKRIYDLKKKNQELEKFKFVLDYKIKELKRQIEPRENEIAEMRTQIEEMDLELEQYHKSNSALDLMIGELRLKMDGMSKEISTQQKKIEMGNEFIAKFRRDLQSVALKIGNNKALKDGVMRLYKIYAQDDITARRKKGAGDGSGADDMQAEYNRQREHLERNVEALKRNITKDVEMHATDNARLIRENVGLTKEINELRRESKDLAIQASGLMIGGLDPKPPTGGTGGRRSNNSMRSGVMSGGSTGIGMAGRGGATNEIEIQNITIDKLTERVNQLKSMVEEGGGRAIAAGGDQPEV